jgi:hypothetical protein
MPAQYDKPRVFARAVVEDYPRFEQLDFYLVNNEVGVFPQWNVFDQLYGDIDWQANMGNVMRGTTPQPSPVGNPFFIPNNITELPKKDIHQVTESTEEARVKRHNHESYKFNFLASFTAFWKNYLQYANKDIVKKIAIRNNQFIETNMWANSPNVYLAGGTLVTACPTEMINAAGTAVGSKTAAWLIATVNGGGGQPGVLQNMTLRDMYMCNIILQEDMAAPPFMGAKNMPDDNKGLQGKYVFLMSSECWMNLTFDKDVLNKLNGLAPCDLNLVFNDFKGLLFGTTTVKFLRHAIRFNTVDVVNPAGDVLYAAGTPIDPEVYDSTTKKNIPNPYFTSLTSAPFELGWALGADIAKTIKVGPPPKEFARTEMSQEKFYSLRWNGEVRLTDQVLINNADGSVDLNVYGEVLKFIGDTVYGYLPGEPRYGFPFIYRRQRPTVLVA